MQEPKLFVLLPDYVSTPDGMEIDKHGNLILSCPNFANPSQSGTIVKISLTGDVRKWFDVPVHPETGVARNMGIAFGPDGDLYICDNQGWSGEKNLQFKGRILRVRVNDEGEIVRAVCVAEDMEHPNGIKIWGDSIFVTQSIMTKVKHESNKLVSCVYKFKLNDKNIRITNTLADPNILTTFITLNPDVQYGADGIEFDKKGNLYVGNFGDGAVCKITFNEDGTVKDNIVIAQDSSQLTSTDGFCFDDEGNLYIADFSANAVCCMTPDYVLHRIAQSPDCDGFDGGLDQPGEPRVWQNRIIVSCFDLVTGPGKVNTAHELPATLSELSLYKRSI
jgi:sugar lactone lactonase YvrE